MVLKMGLEQRRAEGEGERPSPVTAFQTLGPAVPDVGSWILLLDFSFLSFLIPLSQGELGFCHLQPRVLARTPWLLDLKVAYSYFAIINNAAMNVVTYRAYPLIRMISLRYFHCSYLAKGLYIRQGSILDILQIVSSRLAMICVPHLHSPTVCIMMI